MGFMGCRSNAVNVLSASVGFTIGPRHSLTKLVSTRKDRLNPWARGPLRTPQNQDLAKISGFSTPLPSEANATLFSNLTQRNRFSLPDSDRHQQWLLRDDYVLYNHVWWCNWSIVIPLADWVHHYVFWCANIGKSLGWKTTCLFSQVPALPLVQLAVRL